MYLCVYLLNTPCGYGWMKSVLGSRAVSSYEVSHCSKDVPNINHPGSRFTANIIGQFSNSVVKSHPNHLFLQNGILLTMGPYNTDPNCRFNPPCALIPCPILPLITGLHPGVSHITYTVHIWSQWEKWWKMGGEREGREVGNMRNSFPVQGYVL